jgi:hypothetical protein
VQGQLREGPLSVVIETECAYCARPLHIEVDDELTYRVVEEGADPRVFVPLVDFCKLADPSIIDAF